MEGIPTVVTCHTLCGKMKSHEAVHYKAMIPLSTITVAHARYQVEQLKENLGAVPHNVTYVEHGANLHSPEEIAALRSAGKRHFGFEGYQVVGLNGWWAANKNFLPVIKAWGTEIYPRLKNPRTLADTEFRNGNLNLHYRHVNRPKGRTCTACHTPHGSRQKKLIREAFGFGDRTLPIQYEKTETGGTCATACHGPVSYDRCEPAENGLLTTPREGKDATTEELRKSCGK